eukprot:jgi/Astpho2/1963/Aster-x0511
MPKQPHMRETRELFASLSLALMRGGPRQPWRALWGLLEGHKGSVEAGSTEDRTQHYREAVQRLSAAVQHWNIHKDSLQFVLNLGDIIDGQDNPASTQADFDRVSAVLGPLAAPACAEAQQFMSQHPLTPEQPWMEPWNGGLSSAQMRWLRKELQQAADEGEQVVLASHHPLGKGCARTSHLSWTWQEVLSELAAWPRLVRLALHGHDHTGGYARVSGIHFVTLEAMLEAPDASNAFAVITIFEDYIEIAGQGSVTSRTLPLN